MEMECVDCEMNLLGLSFYPLKHTRMTKLRITVKFIVGMLMRVRGLSPRTRTFTRVNVPVISYRVQAGSRCAVHEYISVEDCTEKNRT